MLKIEKNVNKFRKIIVALMVIVMTLGVYIKTEATTPESVEPKEGTTINPIYKPKWEKTSSSINLTDEDTNGNGTLDEGEDTNSNGVLDRPTISIELKGTAGLTTSTLDDGNVKLDYSSTVTGALTTDDITVYINNKKADWITKELTPPADTSEVDSVTYTLTLSRFEETSRQLNVPFKEWSGNIKIRIGGRGEAPETYNADKLVDKYGNQSMMATDETGTWIDVTYQDTNTDHNTNGTMFMDIIRPEFTYEYSNTTIEGENIEKVTLVFDVVDQYFDSSLLTADLITVKVADEVVNSTVEVTKTLTKIKDVYYDKTAGTSYVDTGATGTGAKVGERYQLEITGLDKGDAFKYSGYMTLEFSAGVKDASTGTLISGIMDKSGNLNPGTTITIGIDEPGEILPSTAYTKPYLPSGYTHITSTDLSNGLTIQDRLGNQYVWVEVPTNLYDNASYNTETTTGDRKPDSSTDYDDIEYCLHKYTATYRNGTAYKDIHSGDDASTGLTSTEYTTLKQKMLKSVYENGGFYVGKYETGIADTEPDVIDTNHEARTASGDTTQTPVIQANAYPYNYVTNAQAQTLASGMASGGYTSSLLFGVQWDLVLKHLETKEFATVSELNSNSTEWGNYNNNTYTTNANGKYAISTDSYAWTDGSYNKTASGDVLLSTGASTEFERGGIYDLAGNVYEWTLEYGYRTGNPCAIRGGAYFMYGGNAIPASYRYSYDTSFNSYSYGFRVAIYRDEDATEQGTIVDVVDPIWKVNNIEITENPANLKNSTVTLELSATDKYYLSNIFEEARAAGTLDEALRDNILLYIDGQLDGDADGDGILEEGETPTITKTLSTATNLTPAGTGVKYTLTFSNWDAEKYSGTARFKIPAGTITDQVVEGRNNESNEQEFIIGHIDFTKPVITKVSSENIDTDADGKDDAVQIIFKATDKFMVMDDLITIPTAANPSARDEITVYVDNEVATGITRTLTSEEITEVVNGVTVKGHQYTLVLSDFEQTRTTINRDREFSDWSGTVRIDIAEGAVRDEEVVIVDNPEGEEDEIAGGNISDLTPITGEFADFIKPNVTYEYSSTDIVRNHADKTQRTFTMVFDVTDKYFTSSALGAAFAAATTDAEKLAVLQEYLTIWVDDVDITRVDTVTKKIVGIENVTATMNKTTDIPNKTITENVTNAVIGKRFTLEISNLEQDADTAIGNDFLNYSGVITVGFNTSKPLATDESSNSNLAGSITAPSITSGVTTPGGSGSEVIVDLVDPLWEQGGTAEARPYEQYAKIPIKGTDKYIQTNNLQPSDITITVTTPSGTTTVNGAEASTKGMTLTVTQDTSVTLAYGKQYNVVLTGYAADAYQVKLTLRDGILSDTSGNTSQETSFILFTSLVETYTETSETSEFLSKNKESGQVIPQRQYVEQVIFQNNLSGINETKWDVSQLNDGTIWAWYTTRTAEDGTTLYTVYIGSYIIMNGNVSSRYLFANLGYNENCKVTGDTPGNEFIKNLYILQTASVTDMTAMFYKCGYAKMQSLDLGTAFNTASATDMTSMFRECGYTSMVTFDLGDKFDTSRVTDMQQMFNKCGYTAMTSLDLSSATNATNTTQFNTSNVTNMMQMFHSCGYIAMTTLNLGNNFVTSNVTDMHGMFNECGYTALLELDLGTNFDTSKVTDMGYMFALCGTNAMHTANLGTNFDTRNVTDMEAMFNYFGKALMTSLDLGDKFYTTNVNNMFGMFFRCGNDSMETLDLGPAFTRIPSGNVTTSAFGEQIAYARMFENFGNTSTTIYAPEAIYSDMKNFKTNATATEGTISSGNGTINPIYKPEWEKVSSTLDKGAGKLTVVVKGSANKEFTNGTYTGTYTSDITSSLTANNITVYVDGELAEGIEASDITVSTASTSTNATTGKTEVQYTITISNFEQAVRLAGKNFKEWSGNVELQFAKGTLIDTWGSYIGTDAESNPIVVKDVSKDASGNIVANQNLAVIDIDVAGTMENIVVEDTTKLTANTETTEANMFVDLIKPEYTYTYSTTNPDINTGVESVTVVFDVTDKYFESTALASDSTGSLITVTVDGDENANTPITKVLTKIKDVYYDVTAGINYVNSGSAGTGRKVGERYQLVITGLDREDGFTYSGPMTLTFAAGAEDGSGNLITGVRDNSGNLSTLTAITMGVNSPNNGEILLPGTAYTKPYVPTGYNHIPGTDLSNGLTIQDWLGNQYVWVEVPTNLYDNASYNTETTTGDRKPDSSTDYDDIEYCLHKYTATYRNGTSSKDIHSGNDESTGLTSTEYTTLKQKMLKSVYENGGFYVGKYETGIADTEPDVIDTNHEARTASGDTTQTPVIQANAYPYNFVTNAQAQELSERFSTEGYETSLLFGVQWDLVLKHLETKNFATIDELKTDSTEWGNYNNNNTTYTTNANGKYYGGSWNDGGYNKTVSSSILLSTGASTEFEKGGIYDLAGNVWEWTLEYSFNNTYPCVNRGGFFNISGADWPAGSRNCDLLNKGGWGVGFRVALYKDVDTNETDEPIIVDVVDPIWEIRNAAGQVGEIDKTVDANGNVSASMTLIGKDKYFKQSTLTIDDIKIKVDGIEDISVDANGDGIPDNAPDLVKTLSEPVYIKLDASGNYVETTASDPDVIGVKYEFSMSGLKETDNTFFANRADYNTDSSTGRPYREYSGEMSIIIPADKLEDTTGNKNNLFTIPLNHVDTLKPEVIKVSSQANINETNRELSTHTIVFDIVDKYISSSSITATDTSMIHVYLDGEEAASITKPATTAEQDANVDKIFKEITNIQTLRDDIDRDGTVETDEVVGYRYTLVLSGIEKPRTSINYDREYTDWSGDLSIKIDANTATDTMGTGNDETILYGNEAETADKTKADHVDYVKPDATYEFSSVQDGVSDVIDKNGKTYEMTFDITDKFFQTDGLSISDLSILMSAEEETGTGEDGYYDLMANALIGKAIEKADITNEVVVDVVNGVEVKETRVIGKRYTVRLSNLEQLQRIENNYYLDYSGSITITIPAGKVTDTSGNGNDTTAITTGIDIPGGEVTDISAIDVVQPLWERTAFTTDIHAKTATITLLGTDKYFYEYNLEPGDEGYDADLANKGTLTLEEIGLYINGVATTGTISEGVKTLTDAEGNVIGKLSITSETKLYEERLVQTEYGDGDVDTGYSTETVQYGVQYVLNITELDITAEQIKIHLPEGSLVDKSANPNRTTEFLVYNTLRKAQDASGNWENAETSGFLGNATIQRQNIEKIEFVDSLDAAPTIGTESAEGVILCWDVSAARDNSILAWATQTAEQATKGVYTVYIGSNDDIFGNIDSSYLFSYIGYSTNCTATDTISGIGLLDTRNVTNMSHMFRYCGYAKMSSLNLGNNFDTSNVTDMSYMFQECGYTAMTSLDLGTKFDTSKVTNMKQMFGKCGYTAMTSLDLGIKFDTSNVTSMRNMFWECGYTMMTVLNLGTNFNTSNVTNMYAMFFGTGYEAMTTLNLGTKFDTSNVIDMGQMFRGCGYKSMTSLDLSSGTNVENTTQFNTSNVVNMEYMFINCGYTKMTNLNLGNNFDTSRVTNMRQMFNKCGRTAMTRLDLRDKFYTTNVTNMYAMFANCSALTILDLGPAFTEIPTERNLVSGTETNAYDHMFSGFGNSSTIIYAPESIYANKNSFKLNTTATEGIVSSGNGTINPIYKPEWEKVSSTITVDNANIENSKIEITIKGSANKTFTNGTYTGTYASEITSLITAGNDASNKILVKVDGEIDGDTDRDGVIETGETPTITKTVEVISQSATEVKYKITLSGFEQALRQTGANKNFLEWSGNIAIQPIKGTLVDKYGSYLTTEKQTVTVNDINGNPVEVDVYEAEKGVFTDASGNYIGNKNMISIDDADGNWLDIEIRDASQDAETGNWTDLEDNNTEASTNGTMFTDFIKPEFTYKWSETVINYIDKNVTVAFDVTDKYFDSTTLTSDLITVTVDGRLIGDTNSNGVLDEGEKAQSPITKTLTKVQDLYYEVNGVTNHKVGERYELLLEGLEIENGIGYSGIVTLAFPVGVVKDLSDNSNVGTTITVGIDDPSELYIPKGYTHLEGTDMNSGLVIQDSLGNEYVWIEVPRIAQVYPTAGLNLTEITDEDYEKIENDLHNYTSVYRKGATYTGEYSSSSGLTEEQYNQLKKKMLQSIYLNEGFYVGRYETGIDYSEGVRTTSGNTTQTPVIKQNAYPYNNVTVAQAQTLASRFAEDLEGYTSSVMFDVQWDLILKYLERKGAATQYELNTNSESWGNNFYSTYNITNTNAKYSIDDGNAIWSDAPYEKTEVTSLGTLLSTGASSKFMKQNIYDLAGNLWEFTLEKSNVSRGGNARNHYTEDGRKASARIGSALAHRPYGFRVTLFVEGEASEEQKLPVKKTEGVIVDVVNPLWIGPDNVNNINRTNDKVNITILGSDKFYDSSSISVGEDKDADGVIDPGEDINGNGVLDENNITVYVDEVEQSTITKELTKITDSTQLQELATQAGLSEEEATYVKVAYILTLSTFGENSGETKIVIDSGTIKDISNNVNLETTIYAGNIEWEELNEPLEEGQTGYPRYPAFRENVVDFIKPIITYEYSTVMIDTNGDGTADTSVSANPDIDYEQKEVTVKFKVTDKYLLGSDLIKTTTDAGGNTIQVPKNISISVDGTKVYDGNLETQPYEVTATISETAIDNGKEYTLVISNLQQTNTSQPEDTTPENGDGFNFSGPMTIDFVGGVIDDTSGNKNDATSITLDTHVNPDVVDVVDPIIYKTSSVIDRTAKTVTVYLKAEDKYLNQQVLVANQNLVKVRVEDEYGNIIVEDTTTIRKNITNTFFNTSLQYANFSVVLDNFGVYEGKTTIIIPENMILDTSGNGNVETEILVGSSSDTTAFKDHIVDFTKPTWEYVTSSIERDFDASNRRLENGELGTNNPDGTVTIEVKGTDIYFDKPTYFDNAANQLNLNNVVVYVNGVAKDDIDVNYATNPDGSIYKEYIEETKELATGYSRVLKGVKYKLILSNFGTYDGQVKIDIPVNAIKDTSTLGNIVTPFEVGNPAWVETDEPLTEGQPGYPKYPAFRNHYVDFIKPVITYQYEENVNPKLIRTTDGEGNPVEKVQIQFTTTDTNFLESNIGLEDIKVFIDDDYEMQVYGTGANAGTAITAELNQEDLPEEEGNGIKYTLTLSGLELDRYINSEIFERHSGRVKLIIAADQVYDTSGNPNNEKTIIVDNDDGDDASNIEVVDFVNPNIYYKDKYINWNERYAVITLRATDRYFDDEDSNLQPSDIGLYENNVQITDFAGNIVINKTPLTDAFGNMLGYDYIIRLNEFTEEFQLEVRIPGMKLYDTSGNYNDPTNIFIDLDNRKPTWEYVSTDTSGFEPENGGTISFNVKGVDKFLDIANSNLDVADLQVLLDGEVYLDGSDDEDATKITVNYLGADENEKSKSYKIDVTGLTEVGVYTLVFADGTLIDTFNNESAATTITFSKAVIAPNTANYVNVTYHISPDHETIHSSYVHEVMSVNTTGTNSGNTTYRPSTLGELYNNGANPLFKEPMYKPTVGADGYTMTDVYSPVSFAGWEGLETDSNGNIKYYTDSSLTTVSETETAYTKKVVYGLYDEISNKVTDLKAVWQDATVVFVSASTGNNSNDGRLPTTPVQDLQTAYTKINTTATGTATNNIIVIMDAIEWNSTATLTGNATITSLYGGVDYRATGAELKISSNMTVNGDIIFDNIELYASSSTVSDGTNYLGNGTYTNMLISNYSGDITLGRGITTTATGSYTFGAIIGGNYKTETSDQATHTIRVEAGKYNNIIAGSTLTSSTLTKSATHNVVIGNMKDSAISKNSKLTITGYLAMGENEFKCYPTGVTTSANAATKDYSVVTVYSGTFTGVNKFTKATENSSIYLRSINSATDGKMKFEMFGGQVTGNIYGGASSTSYTSDIYNTMKFYGGKVIGDIFGQSANDTFNGGSNMAFQGVFTMNGNIFGSSNVTTTVTDSTVLGTGASTITIDNISIITGGSINVYGGSKSTAGYMEGNATITLNTGTVTNIYGGGSGSGVQGTTNITINNGHVTGNIFGGGQNGEARTVSNITVLGGLISGNIYGGNDNSDITKDTITQDVNIIIGDTDATKAPTITGNIYGSGQKDNVDKVTIQLIESTDATTVFGGSDENAVTATAEIYLKGMTVDNIYGGGQSAGTVETANIYLQAGTATDVYGGGYAADVTTSNITLEGTTIGTEDVTATVGSIYGGSNNGGTVTTSNVTLKSGNVTNVFGGGNAAAVGTANVTLDGITINTIHGGSKDAGVTTTTNVTLLSGTVENVFGGGLDVGVGTSNVSHESSANVTNIYGGNNSGSGTGGDTTTSNVKISSNVTNVYGGNYLKGTTTNSNVTIHGTPTISGKLFGGGYKSDIGKADAPGSTTIKVVGGTINNDINGGSEEGIIYGTTNMYIGVDSFIDATLTAGNVEIKGTIYGAGSSANSGYTTSSVIGNTNITMDNSSVYPVTYSGSIFGSGKNSTYSTSGTASDESTIHIKDFGTSVDNTYQFVSIERTGSLYIGKSFIELTGRQDEYNFYKRKSYTLNRITKGLTIYDNTTLFNRRGFNMVGGFNSYQTLGGTKATMMNVQNRLYTFEGINLIFAKQEGDIYADPTQDIWGDVNGMTFFGMYAIDRDNPTKKVLDIYAPNFDGDAEEDFFANGTYVEGRHKENHSLTADGFYTNIADYTDPNNITVTQQIIDATDYGKYYDWIVGAGIVNYETTLIGSTYGKESIAELLLDYQYENGATYTLNRVSLNPLNTGINLINSDLIPTISANANNTFGLTMETDRTGWLNSAVTNIYTASDGSFDGDTTYASDTSAGAGKIIFRLNNSINITEKKDLGNVDLILTGRTPERADGTGANTFIVVIAVNIQTIVDEIGNKYEPSFTGRTETELSYTTDSRVDLTYMLYNTVDTMPYTAGDYKVISSTVRFPAGTRITMKDYGQGDSLNKVYYYHVPNTTPATETKDGVTRYIYELSDFIEMGSQDATYADIEAVIADTDNTPYYHAGDGYVYEKYDISIDFIDSSIAQTLANETYLELRNSSGALKYDNDETAIKYNLYSYSSEDPIYRAQFAETISNVGSSYSIVESLEIPLTISASLLEQSGIMDTKYNDQIVGIAIQIVGESGIRIKSPELQNFKLTNVDTGEVYEADTNGVIRMPIIEGFGTKSANYKLSMEQSDVAPGVYTAQVRLYTADDGKYYGTEPAIEKTFSITFISKLAGLVGAEATDDSRIINATTGLNLEEGNTANKAVDMTVGVANPSNETNIRVELYKRNSTYTNITDEESYTGTSYTLVDIADYLQDLEAAQDTDATDDSEDALDTWVTPSTYGLTAANQYEYMVMNKKTYPTPHEIVTIEFEKAIMSGIDTGEYKLVFKAYSNDTLVGTVKKTFIVTP